MDKAESEAMLQAQLAHEIAHVMDEWKRYNPHISTHDCKQMVLAFRRQSKLVTEYTLNEEVKQYNTPFCLFETQFIWRKKQS